MPRKYIFTFFVFLAALLFYFVTDCGLPNQVGIFSDISNAIGNLSCTIHKISLWLGCISILLVLLFVYSDKK